MSGEAAAQALMPEISVVDFVSCAVMGVTGGLPPEMSHGVRILD